MSTKPTGDAAIVDEFVAEAKALVAQAQPAEQLDMLDPVTPEEMLDAREQLGPAAGRLAVLRQARETKRGRPAGSRNKRTDEFKRYILGFGQHPALTLMQIQATPPEVLMEASKRDKVFSVNKEGKLVSYEETMSYEAAQALRVRCAEGLLPYLESKMPTAVDMTFSGVADLVIEGVTHTAAELADYTEVDILADDAEFAPADPEDEA
ncbi:hypothetical protein [Sphingomonas jatrophae]|uniref:Uncharacterized protein n=1 Tax=Sphingomonas jatrophae TaxID=1166337 RepID=A0A1I6K6C8_9SPHN|nr:hypothetical protein [Sphingomonas jatrophae]SFR86628.1 hypothetical protein SAMN05192580_1362 [Sphingomonas jatrophae]